MAAHAATRGAGAAAPAPADAARLEALGPAERVVLALTTWADHCVHNRPGIVVPDASAPHGVHWSAAGWRVENAGTGAAPMPVFAVFERRKGAPPRRIGTLSADDLETVRDGGGHVVAHYRMPGLFPEAVAWLYRHVAQVWRMDNDFAARFGSWAWPREHRDLKCVLAAFLLVQSRSGQDVKGANGAAEFRDDDLRAVGEAMCLLRGAHDVDAKLLLRIGDILRLPAVAAVNRELGFGQSARRAFLGRYPQAVRAWLRFRERNPQMLMGLAQAGQRRMVMRLARRVSYKPESPAFFAALRWRQKQSRLGHRRIAIGAQVAAAESWAGLSEAEVCERIVAQRPGWKRIVGLLPQAVGVTRAVVTAAVEAGALSDADLVILTPTLEGLGLITGDGVVATRWREATQKAENQRAANIAKRVRTAGAKEALAQASDRATAKALDEATRGLRVYVVVDISGSMSQSIDRAKQCLARFVGGIPLDRLHVSVFNTNGREVPIRAASAAAVEHAFAGFAAGGGTDYSSGVHALSHHAPKPDEDALVVFVGDEGETGASRLAEACRALRPAGFGLLKVPGENGRVVTDAAAILGVPCFAVDPEMFTDPYAVTRILRDAIAATPVDAARMRAAGVKPARRSLLAEILQTELLQKPAWATV